MSCTISSHSLILYIKLRSLSMLLHTSQRYLSRYLHCGVRLHATDSQLAAREVKGPLVHEGEYMYHVIGCMGTGMLLTTGVNASRLGLASIRSSPEDTHS
jgi:hypothetical protein